MEEGWDGLGLTEVLGTTRTGLQAVLVGLIKGNLRIALKILLWPTEKMRRGCGMIALVTTQVIATWDMFARNPINEFMHNKLVFGTYSSNENVLMAA